MGMRGLDFDFELCEEGVFENTKFELRNWKTSEFPAWASERESEEEAASARGLSSSENSGRVAFLRERTINSTFAWDRSLSE